jgi:autotransporter passenger strand-loop-strand repeat protein
VLSGGLISGTFGSGTLISAAGTVNVLAGGTGAFLTVSSGGTFNVAGTVLSNVTVSSGAIENVLAGGVVGGASGSGTAISGGTLNVSSGGSLAYVTAWNGGVLNVSAGGTAHKIVAQRFNPVYVHIGHLLMTPQSHRRRRPTIEAQRRRHVPSSGRDGDGFVNGHVGRAGARFVFDDETPAGAREGSHDVVANCELRIANCELRIANCELRIANCELKCHVPGEMGQV